MQPVTALWLIAVPLMDMLRVMIARIRRGTARSSRTGSICTMCCSKPINIPLNFINNDIFSVTTIQYRSIP